MKSKISLFLMLMMIAGVSQAELKIGYVNIAKVMEKSPLTAKAKSRLETEFSGRDKSLETQQKDLKAMEDKMTKDGSVMSESERRRMEKDFGEKRREFERAYREYSEDFNMRRNEELSAIQKRISEVVRNLAKEEQFDLLLADGVMHASEQIDMTQRVLQKLESAQ